MDFATLDIAPVANSGAKCFLVHPATRQALLDAETGEQYYLLLAGQDSDIWKKAQRKITNKRLANRNRAKVTAEELEDENLEVLASCTLGWGPKMVLDGITLEFSLSNVLKVYRRLPWAREQADEFISDRGNYLRD